MQPFMNLEYKDQLKHRLDNLVQSYGASDISYLDFTGIKGDQHVFPNTSTPAARYSAYVNSKTDPTIYGEVKTKLEAEGYTVRVKPHLVMSAQGGRKIEIYLKLSS